MRKWLILAAIALMMLPLTKPVNAAEGGLLYTVTSTGDGGLVGTNTICDDGTGHCTLRAAIEASNSHPGIDGIDFAIPTSDPGFDPGTGAWTINLTKALPDVSADVGITGPGAEVLIVRRDTGGDYRIFNVTVIGTVTFSGLTISNGFAPVALKGGGINNSSTGIVNVINCTISDNHAPVFSFGAGIANFTGTLNVTNCTVSGNSSFASGGGIFNDGGGVNVTNSTLSGNSASGDGGGIDNFIAGGIVNVTNCTLSGNSAVFNGGGIDNEADAAMTVKSSVIALNTAATAGPDINNGGNILSQGFNLIGENDGAEASFPAGNPNANNDIVGTSALPVDPKLDSNGLQDNGGPTQTIALLVGSPALDKGTSNGLTTDQRGTGFARIFDDPAIANAVGGDGTDVGAFEVQAPLPTPTPSPSPSPSPSPFPTPIPTTLGNISTRLRVETGDNVLIGGFIITGTQSKKVIVRAIGPSLPLIGVLADPILELHDLAGTLIASNDNWMDAPNRQEIIDSTIPPPNDFESAILMSLDPGLYTAIVRGVNDTTGVALVEAYDLGLGVDSILANISTRGLVQTGDNVMIGGIIILGTDAQDVLLRAIGPSLPLTGALADPTLELHDKDGVIIATNDDWRTDQEVDIMATGIPPTDDAESAILMTLTPDAYTAIVRGKDNTTGVALVEAYQLDN
jgi:hypothetical protein